MNARFRFPARGLTVIVFLLPLLLVACGGGGGGGGGDTSPPPRSYTVGGTVTGLAGAGLILQNNATDDLAISADGAFAFSNEITDGGAYAVTVLTQPTGPNQTCSVSNGSGTVAGANVTDVQVSCTGSGLALRIGSGQDTGATHDKVAIAVNDMGDALAVWRVYDGVAYIVLFSHFDAASGSWSAEAVLSEKVYGSNRPVVASNGSGFMVVYSEDGRLLAREFTAGSPGAVTPLASGFALDPAIVSDGSGYMVVWRQIGGTEISIYANRYVAGSWGAAVAIETGAGSAYFPAVASNGDGYAAVWVQNDGTALSIHANRYAAGSWGAAELIEKGDGMASTPAIASDGSGYAAVWVQYEGTGYRVFANRYSGSGWRATGEIISDPAVMQQPYSLAVSSRGQGYMAVWSQLDNTGSEAVNRIFARDFTAGAWGDLTSPGTGQFPVIADGGIGAVVLWNEFDAGYWNIYASTLDDAGVWAVAETVDSGTGPAFRPAVAAGVGGVAAVWIQQNDRGWYGVFGASLSDAGWGLASELVSQVYPAAVTEVRLIANDRGERLAVWRQYDGGRFEQGQGFAAYRALYRGGVWWAPERVASSYISSITAATDGNGFLVVYQRRGDLFSQEYREGVWGAETRVNPGLNANGSPRPVLASDSTGYMILWRSTGSPGGEGVYGSVYSAGAWRPAALVEDAPGTIRQLAIASDGAGYMATWARNVGGNNYPDILASEYKQGSWGTPAQVEQGARPAILPMVASDGSGYMLAWRQADGADLSFYANEYGGNWDPAVATRVNRGGWATFAALASAGNGYLLIWTQRDGAVNSAYASRFSQGRWDAPVSLESRDGRVDFVGLAAGPGGYLAAWRQQVEGAWHLYAARHGDGVWGPDQRIDEGSADVDPPAFVTPLYPLALTHTDDGFALAWTSDSAVWVRSGL